MGISRDYSRSGNAILIGTKLENRAWGHSDTDSVIQSNNQGTSSMSTALAV